MSPDGRLLAIADDAGLVRFVNLATWSRVGNDVNLGAPVATRAMSFSPDGRRLMVVVVEPSRSTLEAIDVTSRQARKLLVWQTPTATPPLGSAGVAYSPDGRSIAVSLIRETDFGGVPSAARVLVLHPDTGRVRWERPYPKSSTIQEESHVAFMPNGVLLTSAQHGNTILWNPATGRILRQYPIGGLPAISTDGSEVALGRNTPFADPISSAWVTVLNLRTGHFRTLGAGLSNAWIRGISFIAGDSEIVAEAFDGVHVWNVAPPGTMDESFVAHGYESVMAVDPGRTTAFIGSQDGSVPAS